MILDWFNAEEAVVFAQHLVDDIIKMAPLTPQKKGNLRSGKGGRNDLDRLVYRVRGFATKAPLNIYKKAKFLNVIKWKLRDAGYDEQFVNEIVVLFTAALSA